MEVRMDDYVSHAPEEKDRCVVAAGFVFTGTVEGEPGADLIVLGAINGDVRIEGNLEVSGAVNGDISASSFHSDCAQIVGNMTVAEKAVVGKRAVVRGNISGTDIEITGAVKGDVDAKGEVKLGSTAVVKGTIKSRSITIESGAIVEGQCEPCYADKTADMIFKEIEEGDAPHVSVANEPIEFNDLKDSYDSFSAGSDDVDADAGGYGDAKDELVALIEETASGE